MEQLFSRLFEVFDLYYIITVMFATYAVIMIVNYIQPNWKQVRNGWRKIITILVGVLSGVLFYKLNWAEGKVILPSFFLSQFGYSYFVKYILQFLKIDYDRYNI